MVGKRSLLLFVLFVVTAATLAAQPTIVNIQLKEPREAGGPRTIEVTPRASVVCRNTPNCSTEIGFRWVGSAGSDTTERIVVAYKDGLFWNADGEASQVAASECFQFPEDQNPFELRHGAANERNLVFKQDAAACPDKVTFYFDISCRNEAGDACGGIAPLDPGTMVDNGRR